MSFVSNTSKESLHVEYEGRGGCSSTGRKSIIEVATRFIPRRKIENV